MSCYSLAIHQLSLAITLQEVLKGELQGAIKETIQGAKQKSALSRLFQEALKGPPDRFQLKRFQGHF